MIRFLAFALVLGASPVLAGDVYVWTDKDGRRQISDVVPAKDRAKAHKVDVPDMPAPPAEDLRSAASGGTAAPGGEEATVPLPMPPEDSEPLPGISSK